MYSRSSALAAVVLLIVVLLLAPAAQSADLKWTPYDRPAQYATVVDKEVPIMMRDGVVLYADVSRPDAPGRYPVLITMTPYSKAIAGEAPGYLIARGYVHLAVDVRGQGSSGGTWCNRCEIEQMDGYEVVQWAAAQAWSDGNVGMYGSSYRRSSRSPRRPTTTATSGARGATRTSRSSRRGWRSSWPPR